MRTAILALALLTLLAGYLALGRPPRHDVMIADVRYLRGDRITSTRYHVGVRGDRISYIGRRREAARRTIEGDGLVLAPGFLDTNVPGFILAGAPSELKLLDGVTSYLSAHGGLPGDNLAVHGKPTVLNYATTVGLAGLRRRLSDPSFDVLAGFQAALAQGAYGVSLSPEYDPEAATVSLVRAICERFGAQGVPISFHARYSSRAQELEGVREAIECARHGAPVHLLHLTSTGAAHHPHDATQMIGRARAEGLDVFFDFYPYTLWASSIQRARFRGNWRQRYGVSWSQVRLPGSATALDAESFEALRRTGQHWTVTVESIPQATVDHFALETSAPMGTDSAPYGSGVHPRGAGSFAKFIKDYVHTGRMPLGAALHRFSTRACELFAPYVPDLAQRGRIEVGYAADLVLWRPGAIRDNATVERPLLPSTGVVAALVNGVVVVADGRLIAEGETGRWMRGRL